MGLVNFGINGRPPPNDGALFSFLTPCHFPVGADCFPGTERAPMAQVADLRPADMYPGRFSRLMAPAGIRHNSPSDQTATRNGVEHGYTHPAGPRRWPPSPAATVHRLRIPVCGYP